jgi:cytochrome P450
MPHVSLAIATDRRPPGRVHPLNLNGRTQLIPFVMNPRGFMERMRRDHGDVVTLIGGATPYLFAFGESANRTILGDPDTFHNPEPTDTPLRVVPGSALARLYNGLIQMNGPAHRRQRKVMAQAMNSIWNETLIADMDDEIRSRVAGWPMDGRIDLAAECRIISMHVAMRTLLGLDPRGPGKALAAAMDQWTRLVFSPAALLLPLDLPGLAYAHLQRLSEEIEATIRAMIVARRGRGVTGGDVLSALISEADNGRLEEVALIGQTNFLFMAGHLTTASAMAWTLFCLMAHPQLIAEVAAEGAALEPGSLLSSSTETTLSEAVINEALRLFPPVTWWMRIANGDFELGPWRFVAGTRVIHSPYVSHRDPAHFPEPYAFRPQRWSRSKPSPFAFCPFSAGPRMCLGQRMALAEIRLLLRHVLQRFTPELLSGTRIDVGGLMLTRPSPGLFARLLPAGNTGRAVPFTGTVRKAFRYP